MKVEIAKKIVSLRYVSSYNEDTDMPLFESVADFETKDDVRKYMEDDPYFTEDDIRSVRTEDGKYVFRDSWTEHEEREPVYGYVLYEDIPVVRMVE